MTILPLLRNRGVDARLRCPGRCCWRMGQEGRCKHEGDCVVEPGNGLIYCEDHARLVDRAMRVHYQQNPVLPMEAHAAYDRALAQAAARRKLASDRFCERERARVTAAAAARAIREVRAPLFNIEIWPNGGEYDAALNIWLLNTSLRGRGYEPDEDDDDEPHEEAP